MALHHIERLVSERGITMLAENEQQVSDGGMTYTVTLFHQGRRLILRPSYCRPGEKPDVVNIVFSLLRDAIGIGLYPSRGAWLNQYGTSVTHYKVAHRQTTRLQKFLGEQYERFLWEAEE